VVREDGLLNSTFDLLQEIKLSACVIFVANLRTCALPEIKAGFKRANNPSLCVRILPASISRHAALTRLVSGVRPHIIFHTPPPPRLNPVTISPLAHFYFSDTVEASSHGSCPRPSSGKQHLSNRHSK
jgi:hypothetical protein